MTYRQKQMEAELIPFSDERDVGFREGWKAADESRPYTDEEVEALADAVIAFSESACWPAAWRNASKVKETAERILEAE